MSSLELRARQGWRLGWALLPLALAAPGLAQVPGSGDGPTTVPAVADLQVAAGSSAPSAGTTPAPAAGAPAAPPAPGSPPASGAARPGAPTPPAPLEVRIAPAYQNLAIKGSQADFFRYHRPPSGFFMDLLEVTHRDRAGYPLQQLWWRNLEQPDEKGYLDLHFRDTPSYLRFWRDTAGFYLDPEAPGFDFAHRNNSRIAVRLKRLPPSPAVDLYFWDQGVRVPALAGLLPFTGIDYHAPQYGLRAMLPLGGGKLYLEPRGLNFNDRTGRQPNSDTTWLTGEYVHPLGERASVSAAYDRITTAVSGQNTALWNVFRLDGTVQPLSHMFVDAYFRQQGISLPFTVTSYENRSSLVGVNLSGYPALHTNLRLGLFREDLQERDGLTGLLSHPAWTGGSLRFRAAQPGLGDFVLRFQQRNLSRAPATEISALPDSRTLYYTRDRSADVRLDGFLGQRVNGYATYGWRQRQNEERGSRIILRTATVGATAQVSSRFTVTTEYTQQLWNGNKVPFLSGLIPPPGGLPPQLFFSDSHIATAGLAYQIDGRAAVDLTYNMFNSTGGQSARDHLVILQYRRDVSRTFFYSIGYQYEDFNDIRQDRSYRAIPFLLQVGLNRQFQ